jgi:ubiquinone/menaquinone biosynthesis C-methylase UbiE
MKPQLSKTLHSAQVLSNHRQMTERDALMRGLGYDFAAGIEFVLAQALPLAGSVLEIGTGKGRFMVALAPHVKTLTTVDISAEEQRGARLNARFAGVKTQIKYVLQDAAHLPWPDQTFDAAVTMNAIHHIPHFIQVLEEMQRVVKLGGKLVLADLSPRGFQIMARFHRSEGKTHEHHRCDFRDLQKLLRDRGWTTRLLKGCNQEVLVANGPAKFSLEKDASSATKRGNPLCGAR